MIDGKFTEQLSVQCPTSQGYIDLIIFKIVREPSFAVSSSSDIAIQNVWQPNPDEIIINFSSPAQSSQVLVKEAYFPTWQAMFANRTLPVERENSTGYLLLMIPAGTTQVVLYQSPNGAVWNTVSTVAILLCCIGSIATLVTRRRT